MSDPRGRTLAKVCFPRHSSRVAIVADESRRPHSTGEIVRSGVCWGCRRAVRVGVSADHSLPVVQSRIELILPRQTLVDVRLLREDVSSDREHHAHETNLQTGNKPSKEKKRKEKRSDIKAMSTSTKINITTDRLHDSPCSPIQVSYLHSDEGDAGHTKDSEVPQAMCLEVRVGRRDLPLLEGQTGPTCAHRFVQP